MPHVNVSINGRQYRLACEVGQEERLRRLSSDLDGRITALRGKFGEIGDARLTVMAALMIADELHDADARIQSLEAEIDAYEQARQATRTREEATQQAIEAAFHAAADRIDRLTEALNRAGGPASVAMG